MLEIGVLCRIFCILLGFCAIFISLISADTCTITAICNCTVERTNHTDGPLNICNNTVNPSPTPPPNGSLMEFFALNKNFKMNCKNVDTTNHTTKDPGTPSNETFTLQLAYSCDPPPSPPETHYSTGTILLIIFFTFVFAYFGLGITVNFFLLGARGIEVMPNLSFWKDFPGLVKDGAKYLQNGCTIRPSDLTTTTVEGYDAI